MEPGKSSKYVSEYALLFFILGLVLILGIKQLFPFESVDEVEILNWAKNLDNQLFPALKYPPLFVYLHYILSGLYGMIFSFLGIMEGSHVLTTDTGFRFTLEAGRTINAFMAVLTVYLVYRVGKKFFNKETAFLAAIITAVNPLVILYAHIFKPAILTTLLMTAVLFFLLKYLQTPSTQSIFWAALCYGLAVSAKFNAFPIAIPIIMALFMAPKEKGSLQDQKRGFGRQTISRLLSIAGGATAGFLLGAPNWLFNPLGNIKAFIQQYAPGDGNLYQQFASKSSGQIILEFLGDISNHLGPVLMIIFFLAVIYSFLKRDKQGMLIFCFIAAYLLVLSVFGYYEDRFGLPLFPAVILMIGKFVFMDVKTIFAKFRDNRTSGFKLPMTWWSVAMVIWLLTGVYSIGHTVTNAKTYNLLHTSTPWERTLQYRQQHNITGQGHRFDIARQIFTPKVKGNNIKVTKHFRLKFADRDKGKSFEFVQAHLPTYLNYIKKSQDKVLEDDTLDMSPHRPFYIIKKRRYQPWNPECIYLYRVPSQLAGIVPQGLKAPRLDVPKPMGLPRTFYPSADTSFLPLQTYEQNPGFGKLKTGSYSHWLYSFEEIENLRIYFLCLQENPRFDVNIKLNNKSKTLHFNNSQRVTVVELNDLRPKALFYDYIYHLELEKKNETPNDKPCYFVWEPVFKKNNHRNPKDDGKPEVSLNKVPDSDIPALFSSASYPEWVKEVYEQSGIDLSLLEFLSTRTLAANRRNAPQSELQALFPLEQGNYMLKLDYWQHADTSSTATLDYTCYSPTGSSTKKIPLIEEKSGKPIRQVPLETTEPVSFISLEINRKSLQGKPLPLKRLILIPDFREFFSRKRVQRRK